jgi:hypothetical protein
MRNKKVGHSASILLLVKRKIEQVSLGEKHEKTKLKNKEIKEN